LIRGFPHRSLRETKTSRRLRLSCKRVCQAWHRTSAVQVLVPGMRGAEGEAKGQGVHREVGLEEAQSKCAGRRTGAGEEVWYTRDERARDREVLHRPRVSGINPASTRGTFGVLPGAICWWSRRQGLRAERSALSRPQKSAEGIVGPAQARRVRHPTAERRGNREAKPPRGWAEGPNGVPRGA
jgi:hypothetical protein